MSSNIPIPTKCASNTHWNVLLLTQNIGSIECSTEEVTKENQDKTRQWTDSVASFLQRQAPMDVVVIHLQEIGGKKFNRAFLSHIQGAVGRCHPDAAWCSGFLGPIEDDPETFSAMGAVVFLSRRVAHLASIWCFSKHQFVPISTPKGDFHSGAKFSTAGTSRKGYLLTRLRLGESVLNFMNLHLFHDADNNVAVSQPHPSAYVLKRADAFTEAMTETSQWIHNHPLFVFGDFNLRLDTHHLKALLEDKFGETIRLEKKKIHSHAAIWDFFQNVQNWPALQELDKDASVVLSTILEKTGIALLELPLNFGPTYLLEDDPSRARTNESNKGDDCLVNDVALRINYQHSRFPAWCDRVWYNSAGASLLQAEAEYWTAPLFPMDHGSVYLRFQIQCTS